MKCAVQTVPGQPEEKWRKTYGKGRALIVLDAWHRRGSLMQPLYDEGTNTLGLLLGISTLNCPNLEKAGPVQH